MNRISSTFNRDGFYFQKNVLKKNEIQLIEKEFDHIVKQLKLSGENINARWDSELQNELETNKLSTEVIHTHNVQSFSACLLYTSPSPRDS